MGSMHNPGRRRHFLELQQATLTSDGMGGHVETWTTVGMLFAAIEPVATRSIFGADQRLESVTHRITMRARDDIRSGMRFVKQSRVFEIMTIHDPDETGRYQLCSVREEGR